MKLDMMMLERGISSKDLAEMIGTTPVNLSRIKTGQIKGIRFGTLYEICKILDCQPGDILKCVIDDDNAEAEELSGPQELF
ncbi:MAG: helix-turn-helix transcriptional regulator [Eggerthellaceae bacterium]|nr:helix-turn-helix transcriptional regulator [Eggerthellaceae bacterium]